MRKKGKFESGTRVLVSKKGHRTGSKLLMAFVSSFMSLLLCCTMFLSTTMAWFTDTIVSAGNQIKIGTLAIDATFKGRSLNPEKKENPEALFLSSLAWQPGMFEARELTIENSGDLDVKYMLNLDIDNPDVAKYFDVYVKDGPVENGSVDTEAERNTWRKVGKLTDIQTDGTYAKEKTLVAPGKASGESTDTFGIALHMRELTSAEDSGKVIFGETFDVSVWLYATQTDAADQAQSTLKMVRPTEAETEPVETTVATEATVPQLKNSKKIMSQAKPAETTAPQSEPTETTAHQTEPTETTAPQTEPTETSAPQTEPTETTAPQTEPTETTAPQTEPTTATTVSTEAPTETTVATTSTGDGQQ